MAYRAKTTIQHGVGDDVYNYEKGEDLDESLFTQEHLKGLLEVGAIEEASGRSEQSSGDGTKSAVELDENGNPITFNDAG